MILIRGLTKRYKSKNKKICTALDGIDLTLPDKGMIFVIGKSGSGKSTLLNMIGGLDSFDEGTIISGGNDLSTFKGRDFYKYRASHVGFIFQDFHLIEELTVAENIRLSSEIANAENEDIERALAEVDLEGYGDRYPTELSGGEKQRVVIARALIKSPDIILCDEPAGNLDNNTSAGIMELLHGISRERLVITVSHDMPDAEKYGDRIIELQGGRIVRDSTKRPEYTNEVTVDQDDTLILPHNRDLTDGDIEFIKSKNRERPIRNIKQNDWGYTPTKKIADTEKKTDLRISVMKIKTGLKLFAAFLNASKVRAATTALISAAMLTLLVILQSFLTFDGTRALSGTLDDGENTLSLRKSIYLEADGTKIEDYLYHVTEDDLKAVRDLAGDGTRTHLLYSYALPMQYRSIDSTVENEILPTDTYGMNNIYVSKMHGTLACDEEYLLSKFGVDGEIRVLAGDIHQSKTSSGIILTDYLADAMMAKGYTTCKSYNDIVNMSFSPGSSTICGNVVAVIDTGYKEKYAEEIEIVSKNTQTSSPGIFLLETEVLTNLTQDISTNLAIGYTLNEDFIGAIANDFATGGRNYASANGFVISNGDKSSLLGDFYISYREGCQPGEIILCGNHLYELAAQGIIDPSDIDDLSYSSYIELENPITIKLKKHEFRSDGSDAVYEKEFSVVAIDQRVTRSLVNPQDLAELISYDITPYAIYFDNYNNIDKVIDTLEKQGFMWPATESDTITFLMDSINMFVDLFEMLKVIVIALIVAFLGSYGISNVRANRYQIGVIKAMGGRSGDIAKIYLLENLVISLVTCILCYFGSLLLVDEANQLVLSSFETIVGEKFGKLTIIAFSNELLLGAFGITLALGIVSTVIPLIILHGIKPIKIIKASE